MDVGAGVAGIERDLRRFLGFPAGIPIVVWVPAYVLVLGGWAGVARIVSTRSG